MLVVLGYRMFIEMFLYTVWETNHICNLWVHICWLFWLNFHVVLTGIKQTLSLCHAETYCIMRFSLLQKKRRTKKSIKTSVKLVRMTLISTLRLIVEVEPHVHLCTVVMFRLSVLLTVYTPHSFGITVFTGHDYSAQSHATFTSHRNVLIWCFTDREDHARLWWVGV